MKNLKIFCLLTFVFVGLLANAQENKVKIKIGGHVATEAAYDSYKMISSRQGMILLFPASKSLDDNDNNLNDRSSFMMTALETRLNIAISGFSAFGAKGSAFIEGDFSGTSNSYSGLIRLRHAYIKLDWGKYNVVAGKYWHPLFVPSAFPRVIHVGGAIPFGVLSRAPQLRYTRNIGEATSINFAVLSEMDFASKGPGKNVGKLYMEEAVASSSFAQQSGTPEFTVQIKSQLNSAVEVGATLGYKTIMPFAINADTIRTSEKLGSSYANAWIGLTTSKFKWNTQVIYGQNMHAFSMLGGYGVKNIKDNGDYEYTNIATSSFTSDIYTITGNIRYGLNVNYTKNHGAEDDLVSNGEKGLMLYSRGGNIDHLYQISPRAEFISGKISLGVEAIYTAAAYGKTQKDGRVKDTNTVDGTRLLLHLKYSF